MSQVFYDIIDDKYKMTQEHRKMIEQLFCSRFLLHFRRKCLIFSHGMYYEDKKEAKFVECIDQLTSQETQDLQK